MKRSTFILTILSVFTSFSLTAQNEVLAEWFLNEKFSKVSDAYYNKYIIDRATKEKVSKVYDMIDVFSPQGFAIAKYTSESENYNAETKELYKVKQFGGTTTYSQTTVSRGVPTSTTYYDLIHLSGKVIFTAKKKGLHVKRDTTILDVKGDTAIVKKGRKHLYYKIDSNLSPRLFKVTRWDEKKEENVVVKTIH